MSNTTKRKNIKFDIKNVQIYKKLKGLTEKQNLYIKAISDSVITIALGGAGTGKTFCAVALALKMLIDGKVEKIIITRPMVECGGEKLGFLPGTYEEKIHPYLLPIFDVLTEFTTAENINNCIELGLIEIIPLAYARGRTFSNCIVVADEMQNSNLKQLKMLLTRLGNNCRMVLNGDATQSDLLPKENTFLNSINKLSGLDGVTIVEFENEDIVRHPLIADIIKRLGE